VIHKNVVHLWSWLWKILMDFKNFNISGNGNECSLQVSYLLIDFTCDVNMTSCSWHLWACSHVCCMCGDDWSSRWLMTQLTNGQHACTLVFMPCGHFEHTFWLSVYFLCTWCFTPCIIKSMKCDVSFSQGSVITLFRWGEHIFYVCVKMFFLLTAVQKL